MENISKLNNSAWGLCMCVLFLSTLKIYFSLRLITDLYLKGGYRRYETDASLITGDSTYYSLDRSLELGSLSPRPMVFNLPNDPLIPHVVVTPTIKFCCYFRTVIFLLL